MALLLTLIRRWEWMMAQDVKGMKEEQHDHVELVPSQSRKAPTKGVHKRVLFGRLREKVKKQATFFPVTG